MKDIGLIAGKYLPINSSRTAEYRQSVHVQKEQEGPAKLHLRNTALVCSISARDCFAAWKRPDKLPFEGMSILSFMRKRTILGNAES